MKTKHIKHSLLALALPMLAGSALADSELPAARDLVDRHIEAIGGIAAVEAQTEFTMTGTFGTPAAGLTGQMTMVSRAPAESVVKIELPGIGLIHTGYTNGKAWSVDPFMGPRLLEGKELATQADANEPGAILRSDEFVASMSTTGLAEYNDQSCYKVEIEWRSGRESTDCYAVESGLLIATESTEESAMGVMQISTIMGGYETFDGVRLPTVSRILTMGQEQRLEIDSIEFGAPADEYFELPPAIQTLMADQAEE